MSGCTNHHLVAHLLIFSAAAAPPPPPNYNTLSHKINSLIVIVLGLLAFQSLPCLSIVMVTSTTNDPPIVLRSIDRSASFTHINTSSHHHHHSTDDIAMRTSSPSSSPSSPPPPPQRHEWPRFREAPVFRNGKECATTSNEYYYTSSSAPRGNHLESRHRNSIDSDIDRVVCDSRSVHIAMTLDIAYIRGSVAAILSIVQHSTCPEDVVFHLVTSSLDLQEDLSQLIRRTFPYLSFKLYYFNASLVEGKISHSIREALEQPLNYARSYLGDLLPECVKRVIYLDSDVIVLDDIAKLWGTELGGRALGAPEHCRANFSAYFSDEFWRERALWGAAFGERGRRGALCYFNTGVMVMDMEMWRREGYTGEIERWMGVQKERRIYELGSLPPFLLVFAGSIHGIEQRWNQHGLGGDNLAGTECRGLHPGPVSLLHWSGKGKPWLRLHTRRPCPLDTLWAPYDLAFTWQDTLE